MDEKVIDAVEQFFDGFADAWATNDGATVASFFAEDGSLINPFGDRADGRSAVAAMYTQFFGTILKGTTTTTSVGSVRDVGADNVFVDGEQSIVDANGDVVLAVHVAALLGREDDAWRFVDARPYTIPAPPG